jgi:hypothetical protein
LCVFWKFLYLLTIKVLTKCLLQISVFYYWVNRQLFSMPNVF